MVFFGVVQIVKHQSVLVQMPVLNMPHALLLILVNIQHVMEFQATTQLYAQGTEHVQKLINVNANLPITLVQTVNFLHVVII